jgi:hypothetical protein
VTENATKKCGHCKKVKSVKEFARDSSRADGLCVQCSECRSEFYRKYRRGNVNRVSRGLGVVSEKKCYRCKVKKSASEFHKRKGSKDGLDGYCKSCWIKLREEYKKRKTQASERA